MKLNDRDFDKVDEEFLRNLVKDGTTEDRHLEFKEKLEVTTDKQKKEFLADVTSFANAAGGVLVYGIRAKGKVAAELCGVDLAQPDNEEARLNSIIVSGTDPRVPGFRVIPVPLPSLAASRYAVVIGVPSSWMGPHMVAYKTKQNTRFYSRKSNCKYALDVTELRNAFLLTETSGERIRRFRDERLSRIVADEGSVILSGHVKSVLHVVPFSAADPACAIDMSLFRSRGAVWQTLWALRWQDDLPNFEGHLFRGGKCSTGVGRYLQVFRSGSVESVNSDDGFAAPQSTNVRCIRMELFEERARDALFSVIEAYRQLAVEPPVFVMYALNGVAGMVVGNPNSDMWNDGTFLPLNRDTLSVPERLIESYDSNLDALLHTMFDEVWNASGWPGSPSWDTEHEWLGRGAG